MLLFAYALPHGFKTGELCFGFSDEGSVARVEEGEDGGDAVEIVSNGFA